MGTVSCKCERYESGWSRCGKKKGRVRVKSVRIVTTFKDHLVTWIVDYIQCVNSEGEARHLLDELDHR